MSRTVKPHLPIFYIYCLFRPNGCPCYIGKGHGKRIDGHEKYATNRHLASIIKLAGGSVPKVILQAGLDEATALAYEKVLIAAIGRDIHGGPLVNLTDGGEGCAGLVATPTARANMSKAKTGKVFAPSTCEKIGEANRTRVWTMEMRANAGKAIAARGGASKNTKLKMRKTRQENPPNEDIRWKIGSAARGKVFSEERRSNMAKAARERWARSKSVSTTAPKELEDV